MLKKMFFNQYIHLTAVEFAEKIRRWNQSAHGLVIIILNDIGTCINSKEIKSKAEGEAYCN